MGIFSIMEKDILPKDPTLTEIAKTIRHVSDKTIYRVHSGKNYYWPVLSMAIYKTVVRTQSTKQEDKPSEKQKTQHRVRRKEKSVTFEPSPYQNIFSECKLGDIRDTVTKVHRKGIITYEEGVLNRTD